MFTEYLEKINFHSLLLEKGSRLPFPPAFDRAAWAKVPAAMREEVLAAAKAQQDTPYPMLTAAQFLAFVLSGSRTAYEAPYFTRRRMLLTAMLAECLINDGAYMDQVVDGLWCICEESFWGISAHNGSSHLGVRPAAERPLPDVENPYIDLFAAQTSALLLWVCYLLRDKLDAVSPLIVRRVHMEAERRIIMPFMYHDDFWWMGMIRKDMNNWTPWILSNIISSLILKETDDLRLAEGVQRAMRMLDSYLAVMPLDGGCDEGAGYWNMAGGSLLDCLEHIYYLTGGKVPFYDQPHIHTIGAFPLKAHIAGSYFWNFADCDAKPMLDGERIYRFGQRTNQTELAALGARIASLDPSILPKDTPEAYRVLCKLFFQVPVPESSPREDETVILPDLQVWAQRRKSLYAAVKAGHNGESHNHNDVGSFLLYIDGEPEIVDAGNMTYTAKTFSEERYTLWNTRSMYHNVPMVGGFEQQPGREHSAQDVNITQDRIFMNLLAAYPKEAGMERFARTAFFQEDAFVLKDDVRLDREAPITWAFLLRNRPEVRTGTIETERMLLSFDKALKPVLEEIPITDARMAKSFPGSLWRITLWAEAKLEHSQSFAFSRRMS